jgi:hypothetical protein
MINKRLLSKLALPIGVGFFLLVPLMDRFRGDSSRAAHAYAAGLIVFNTLLVIFICRIHTEEITRELSTKVKDELAKVISNHLTTHVDVVLKLRNEAERAGKQLQANNPESDIQRLLLTAEDISRIESAPVKNLIYVVTRDLTFDRQIQDIVRANLRAGVQYLYLIRQSPTCADDFDRYVRELRLRSDAHARIKRSFISQESFIFPVDLVVYVPIGGSLDGYVNIPPVNVDRRGTIKAVRLIGLEALANIKTALEGILQKYPANPVQGGSQLSE